jgi:serine phosphatase RsbU (regulator of sigma subunit)
MTQEPKVLNGSTLERLSGHIESLQEAFRKLSSAATLKDLAGQFSAVVHEIFPSAGIDLFYKQEGAEHWQRLSTGKVPGLEWSLPSPQGKSSLAWSVEEKSKSVAIVQRLVDKSHFGMVLSQYLQDDAIPDVDLVSLRLFVHLFENAYQELLYRRNEKELVFSLNHRVLQLNSLIDTGIEVSKLDQGSSPEHLALERAASLTNASKGTVRITRDDKLKEQIFFPDRAPIDGTARLEHSIAASFTFAEDTYSFELYEKESRAGVVPFDDTDQLLLEALARQVHASLENRFLHQQSLEKQRIEQEMSVAASIQQKIIPISLPAIENYDIAGINIPSKSVGGDYYDCIPLPDGRYALVIADVAGKGMPAALLVSSLHAYLAAYLESPLALTELARRLNKVIAHASTDDKFITALIALLTPSTGEIESLNAGHNPSYVMKNHNELHELKVGGIPLGMLDTDLPYESEKIALEKGERLLLYTDGITEAANEKNKFYDDAKPLSELFLRHTPEKAETFIADLISDIKQFTGSAPQSDDITALYLHRQP